MDIIKFTIKTILPPIMCVLLIYIYKIPIEYSILTFGLIIGIVNWRLHSYNKFLGVLLSVVLPVIVFLLAYLILLVSLILKEKETIIAITLIMYVIAPLLTIYSYKLIFKSKLFNTSFSIYVISFSIILLILQSYLFTKYPKIETNAFNSQTLWQFIIALALQLILYQNELKALFKPKIEK